MPKPNPLTQGLERKSSISIAAPIQTERLTKPVAIPSRSGRVLIAGHFAPEVQTALKIVAAEERTTVQALLAEGINTIFAKRGKPEIAEFTTTGN
jgi:hypothetical protein